MCADIVFHPNPHLSSGQPVWLNQSAEDIPSIPAWSAEWSATDVHSFIHSGHFYSAHSIAPIQVLYYSEALPTIARILYRRFTPKRTGNCRYRTCPRSLRGG